MVYIYRVSYIYIYIYGTVIVAPGKKNYIKLRFTVQNASFIFSCVYEGDKTEFSS